MTSFQTEIQRLCSTPEHLRSHWPQDLLYAVKAYEDLEVRAIKLSDRLDFLEELIEDREFCESVYREYHEKFFSVIESSHTNHPPTIGRPVKNVRTKGQCRY